VNAYEVASAQTLPSVGPSLSSLFCGYLLGSNLW